LLSCSNAEGHVCLDGEAAISGSFWSAPGLQTTLQESDSVRGAPRVAVLNTIEKLTVEGAAYIPVWLESPRSWSQPSLKPPQYNRSGFLRLAELQRVSQKQGDN
jgi:peptide/nickel transport system substrate-binding protein